ncbi:MAG: PhnD/SsuA/transferrin family substrate-binding protein [Cyanobacteriota bacterium]
MSLRFSRRLFLLVLLFLTAAGCKSTQSPEGQLLIGVISYSEGEHAIDRYANFNRYLGKKTGAHIELEPAFNEKKALERIQSHAWSLVFAPAGLAAIAIADYQYLPLFPLQDFNHSRSILVVRKDSSIQELKQLEGQTVALGQVGSATGYYLPIYNLYGLTLAEVLFAPTPKTVLEWVAQGKATAGALSLAEFNLYSPQFNQTEFRVLYIDPHDVPLGMVLIAPTVERNRQEQLRKIMSASPSSLIQETGYVPNQPLPDYQYMISVVKRVRSIATHLHKKPARLF